MSCEQCKGITKQNTRCRLPTCKYSPYCWHHTKVEVKKSGIQNAGRGLFARRNIRNKEIFGNYKLGTKKMTQEQYDIKYPDNEATHVAKIGTFYYDGIDTNKSIAGLANTLPKRNNAKINNGGKLVAKKNINQGKEIFLAYGKSYRRNF